MSFQNCKIIGANVEQTEYRKESGKRGEQSLVLSSSELRLVFKKCPSAWINGYVVPESESLEYGSLVDCLVLTPDKFDSLYAVRPETYRDDKGNEKPWHHASNHCKAWLEEHEGFNIVSKSELDEAKKAVGRLMADEKIAALLESSDKQVWIKGEWLDEETGLVIPCQCLIDIAQRFVPLTRLAIGDLKTTRNASPLDWAKWARFAGYDLQAAWNLDMFNAATGEKRFDFQFILSESEPPYEVGRRYATIDELDGERDERSSIMSGRRMYRRMIGDYCKFLKAGYWPSYDDNDESNSTGWTRLDTDPWEEQRRMFAPKYTLPEGDSGNQDLPPEDGGFDVLP